MTSTAPSKRFFFTVAIGGVDQVGAVVDGFGRRRPPAAILLISSIFACDALGDGAAVFADEHEDRAEHGLLAVLGRCAGAQFLADDDVGHVVDVQRHAVAIAHDDVAGCPRSPRPGRGCG